MSENHHTTDGNTNRWPRQMPFIVPEDFFHTQQVKIMQEIRQLGSVKKPVQVIAELEKISPLLAKTKLQGVSGKWDDRSPKIAATYNNEDAESLNTQAPVVELPTPSSKQTAWWKVAAISTGIIIMLGFLWIQPDVPTQYAITEEQNNRSVMDSIGFTDEEITSFLNESGHPADDSSANKISETYLEINVNSTEMLIEPVLFDQQLEAIPVADLEAFIMDISPASE
jgi:hypothetical protein